MKCIVPSHVVLTGAASGIGRAVARLLAAEGSRLSLVDVSVESLETVAREARAAGAPEVLVHTVDVSRSEEMAEVFAATHAAWGRIDGVVSAAGVMRAASLGELTDDDWNRQWEVNTGGALNSLRGAHRYLGRGGAVVVVGSNAARVPRAAMAGYAASKAAAAALTRTVGLELAVRGVRCNVVEPGSTDTPMQRAVWPEEQVGREQALRGAPSEHRVGIPLGRIADPEDIAHAVAFLLSHQARHVTMQQLLVDGGASL